MADPRSSTSRPFDIGSRQGSAELTPEPSRGARPKRRRFFYSVLIVFAGDSLIAEGPWAELYSPIKNRGIGGETTAGLFDRLHLNLDGYLGLGRLLENHVVDRIRQER